MFIVASQKMKNIMQKILYNKTTKNVFADGKKKQEKRNKIFDCINFYHIFPALSLKSNKRNKIRQTLRRFPSL